MNIASLALGCAFLAQAAEPPRRYPGAEAAESSVESETAPPFEGRGAATAPPSKKSSDPFERSSERAPSVIAPAVEEPPATLPKLPPAKSKPKPIPANPLRRDAPAVSTPTEREPAARPRELEELPAERSYPVRSAAPATKAPANRPTATKAPARIELPTQAPGTLPVDQAELIDGQAPRISAKDLIAGLVVAPAGQGLSGEPLKLADAFVRSARRFPPTDVAQAYWGLAAATAEFHQRRSEAEELEILSRSLEGAAGQPAELKLALGSARAALAESKLTAIGAQQRLAAFTGYVPPALPIVADFPHTGTYQTFFDEIFAGRAAPPELALLNRTLPLEREVLLARTQATLAAMDDLEATMTEFEAGKGPLTSALTAIAENGRQQRALVRAAEVYNRDIARYAMQAVPAGIDPLRMAGMLIRDASPASTTAPSTRPVMASPPPGVIRRAENETPADEIFDPRVRPANLEEATPSANDPNWRPSVSGETGSAPAPAVSNDSRPTIRSIYVPKAGDGRDEGVIPAAGVREAPSVEESRREPQASPPRYRAQRPRSGGAALYSGLADASPSEQAKSLAGLLGGHPAAKDTSRQVTLEECLTLATGRDPRQVRGTYWKACVLAAQCEILIGTQVQFAELESVGKIPETGRAKLTLRAAAAKVTADLAQRRVELLVAQWFLTQTAGQNVRGPWLYPTANLAAPDWLVQKDGDDSRSTQAPLQRDQRALLRTAISQRAAAVVAADTLRAMHFDALQTGQAPVAGALAATATQSEATLAFVGTLALFYDAN